MTNDIVTIGSSSLQTKEYRNLRVVTFKDVDTVHERAEGTAKKRFNDNRERFVEGEDYFKVKCSEVRPFFGPTLPNGFNPKADVILLTESGYLMLVKSFTDDLAWKVQRQLVKSYFRAKEAQPRPMNLMEMLALQVQINQELSDRVDTVEEKVSTMVETLALPSPGADTWQKTMNARMNKLCTRHALDHEATRSDLYKSLEDVARVNLKSRLKNLRARMHSAGATKSQISAASRLTVIAADPKLRAIYESLFNKLAASYAVDEAS